MVCGLGLSEIGSNRPECRDTYNRAWRTWGASHARWSLQKNKEQDGEPETEQKPVLWYLPPAPAADLRRLSDVRAEPFS